MSSSNDHEAFSGGASVLNDGTLSGGSSSGLQTSMLNSTAVIGLKPPCYNKPVEETDTILGPMTLKHTNLGGLGPQYKQFLKNFCDRHLGPLHYTMTFECIDPVDGKTAHYVQGYKCKNPKSCAITENKTIHAWNGEEERTWNDLHRQIVEEKELPENKNKVYKYQAGLDNAGLELDEALQENIREALKRKA